MTTIPTVTGEISVDRLGTMLMHEHVFIRTPELQEAWPGFMDWAEERDLDLARERLLALKRSGIDTIVDLTVPGLGRDVHRVARAVEGTGLQVIAATGYYTYTTLPWPLKYYGPGKMLRDDPDDEILVDLFTGDIEQGIQGTGIRAGVLKVCTDEPGVTPDVDRVLRAVARTHLRTDVPIITHTHAGTRRGLDQQRVFTEEGVDLARVVIGHSNETTDLDYLTALMDAGSLIGWDRCGMDLVVDLRTQIDTLAELCRRGYAEKIVLSHDRHCRSDWFHENDVERVVPKWNHRYVQDELIPAMQERGVTDDQVNQMLVVNPRTFFAARSGRG
ncbi:phosphotriesterase family protein [Spirillospora sp. CA-108201]